MELFDFFLYKTIAEGAGAPEPDANRLGALGSLFPAEQRMAGVMLIQSEAAARAAATAPAPSTTPATDVFSTAPTTSDGAAAGGDRDCDAVVNDLRNQLIAAHNDLGTLKGQLAVTGADLDAMTVERDKARDDVADTKAELAAEQAARKVAEAATKAVESALEVAAADLEKANKRNDALQRQLGELGEQLEQATAELEACRKELGAPPEG